MFDKLRQRSKLNESEQSAMEQGMRTALLTKMIQNQNIGVLLIMALVTIAGFYEHNLFLLLPVWGATVLFGLVSYRLVMEQKMVWGSMLFIIGTCFAVAVINFLRGYQDVSSIFFLWPILAAIIAFDATTAAIILVSSTIYLLVLAILQQFGIHKPILPYESQREDLLSLGTLLIILFLIVNQMRYYSQNFKKALNVAQDIALGWQDLNEVLEMRVKERTQELQDSNELLGKAYTQLKSNQQALLISEKMASLGRLTAGIAHEINTPLAAVRASLMELNHLIKEYQDSVNDPSVTVSDHHEIAGEMQKAVLVSTASAERAAAFVQSIKLQTRSAGALDRQHFNAVVVIRESLLLLNYALRQSNCQVIFEPPEEHLDLVGAPGSFAQIVTNIVTNAIDASLPKGGGPITIHLAANKKQGRLEISDQGTGIFPEVLPNIFDPLFTTKPFGQGTGLGLTIVHKIVTDEFSGEIKVKSKPGLGTTFVINFPRRKEEAKHDT